MYKITFSPEAETDLSKLKRSEPASFKKAVKLLNDTASAIWKNAETLLGL